MTSLHLSSETIEFRQRIIDTCWDDARFGYVDANVFIGSCPGCQAALGVHFAYAAPRAVLTCYGGCSETEIAQRLGMVVRP